MWRCLAGCDFDLCESCSSAAPLAPVIVTGVPVGAGAGGLGAAYGRPVQTNSPPMGLPDSPPMGLPVTEHGIAGGGFLQQVERIRSALGIDASLAAPAVLAQAATMMGVVPEGSLPQQVERLIALGL